MVKKKIATILKSQSGASLAFYLAIMFFLMAIAGSVLASASTAAGIAGERRKDVQLDIYVESVVKSLNETIVNGSLGTSIVNTIYSVGKKISDGDSVAYPTLFNLVPKINISGPTIPADLKITKIDMKILSPDVRIIPALIDESGATLSPAMGSVNFQMESVVTGEYNKKLIFVKTTYNYSGELEGVLNTPNKIVGIWQVVSYEKTDRGLTI